MTSSQIMTAESCLS